MKTPIQQFTQWYLDSDISKTLTEKNHFIVLNKLRNLLIEEKSALELAHRDGEDFQKYKRKWGNYSTDEYYLNIYKDIKIEK
jgi:hypothetical protein